MPDRNRGRSEWYRPTYLAAPFKKTARRTGIPNGTENKGSVNLRFGNERNDCASSPAVYARMGRGRMVTRTVGFNRTRRALSPLPRLQVHAVHFLWQPNAISVSNWTTPPPRPTDGSRRCAAVGGLGICDISVG